jgi:hypothetical protein
MKDPAITFQILGGLFLWYCLFRKQIESLKKKMLMLGEKIELFLFSLSSRKIVMFHAIISIALSHIDEICLVSFQFSWWILVIFFPEPLLRRASKKFLKEPLETMYLILHAPFLMLLF